MTTRTTIGSPGYWSTVDERNFWFMFAARPRSSETGLPRSRKRSEAEIAWRLGKRYAQDQPLDWGAAAPAPEADRTRLAEAGHTLRARKES